MAENESKEILNPRQNNKTNRQKREEEQKQIKMLKLFGMIAGGIVVVLLIVGLIVGLINQPSRKTVAKVGDESIKLDEFQSAVRMQRSNLNNNYQYMAQLYSQFGLPMDESTRESYASQMSDSYKGILGQTVLTSLIDQRILKFGAAKEGIEVSDDEVEAYYQSMFGYYPNGTPTAGPTSAPFEPTPTVSEEQLAILRYTETPLPTEVPTEEPEETGDAVEEAAAEAEAVVEEAVDAVEEAAAEAVEGGAETAAAAEAAVEEAVTEAEETAAEAVESIEGAVEETVSEAQQTAAEAVENIEEAVSEAEAAAEDVTEEVDEAVSDTAELIQEAIADPTATSEPTIAPTPTTYTEDMFKAYESTYFANNYYYTKDFFKNQLRYELLRGKVEDKLEEGIERTADMVWARHILVETEEEAQAALDRLNAGEEWGDVVLVSTDEGTVNNGGDLGWFPQGRMVQAFNDAAFSQEVGTISEKPVQTDYGYHIIQVIAHEEHPYTSSEYSEAVQLAYQNWLSGYEEQLDVNIQIQNIGDVTPTDPAFVG